MSQEALTEAIRLKHTIEANVAIMLKEFTTRTGLTVHDIHLATVDISNLDGKKRHEYTVGVDIRVDGYW